MCAAVCVDELGVDPHLSGAGLHRAFQHIPHTQILADGFGVHGLALESEGGVARDDEEVGDARDTRGQFVGQGVGEVILRRIARKIGEGQHHDGKTLRRERRRRVRRSGRCRVCRDDSRTVRCEQIPCARCYHDQQGCDPGGEQGQARTVLLREGLRLRRLADLERIDPYRLGDILELRRAEIGDGEIEPSLDLPVGLLGQTDRARLANAFEARGDIDAVAHQIAVRLLDYIAEMDANAELNATLRRHARVALHETVLHLDCAANRIHYAAKLDEAAVAGSLDDAPVMRVDGGINQVAPQTPEP